MTSHSPSFACQSPLKSLTAVYLKNEHVIGRSLEDFGLKPETEDGIERYLDATKAELFFAKRILMVEGPSEALLLPVLAKALKQDFDLRKHSITIINIDGLAFQPFMELFAPKRIEIPVAIVTDADPAKDIFPNTGETFEPSDTLKMLKGKETDNLKVFYGNKTFEYDLALAGNTDLMIEALSLEHPIIAKEIKDQFTESTSVHTKATLFFQRAFQGGTKVSKPIFAQNLARIFDSKPSDILLRRINS